VVVRGSTSRVMPCVWGVPQGSVLGPALFSLYTAPIERLIYDKGSLHSSYADDVNVSSPIDATNPDACPAVAAVSSLKDWYIQNGMLPNPDKFEVMVVGTFAQLSKFDQPLYIDVAASRVTCSESIQSLGVSIDSGLTCNLRINDIISACH